MIVIMVKDLRKNGHSVVHCTSDTIPMSGLPACQFAI